MPRLIIVGYDPGLTTAFAAVDLNGRFITAQKKKEWPSAAVAQAIREVGRPLVIAVDKRRASEKAEKLAARFGCKLWSPEKDLGVKEKNEVVKRIIEGENFKEPQSFSSHEKDAIAAAFFAFKEFEKLFLKIDNALLRAGLENHKEDVKRAIVFGEAKNINEALERIKEKKVRKEKRVEKDQPQTGKREAQLKSKIKRLERSLEIQKLYIERLEKKVKELERAKAQLQREQLKKSEKGRREVLQRREIRLRENIIAGLQTEVSKLKRLNKKLIKEIEKRDEFVQIVEDGNVPLVPVEEWSREALAVADRAYKAKDKILWVKRFVQSNAATRYCIALHPKAIVMEPDEVTERMLRNADIAIVKSIKPVEHNFYGSVSRKEFEAATKSSARVGFLKWLKEYQERHII